MQALSMVSQSEIEPSKAGGCWSNYHSSFPPVPVLMVTAFSLLGGKSVLIG